MEEWWSYAISDFLLFSPRTYYRLYELYNRAVWPAHVLAIAFAVGILFLLRRGTPMRNRCVTAALVVSWLWIAWGFHYTRYSTINWPVVYVAVIFAVEAIALLLAGVVGGELMYKPGGDLPGWVGLILFVFACIAYPLIGIWSGREWVQIEIFGLAPDPTAVGTAGLLMLARARLRFALLLIPLLWCAFTALTLYALEASEALVPAIAATIALATGFYSAFRPTRAA